MIACARAHDASSRASRSRGNPRWRRGTWWGALAAGLLALAPAPAHAQGYVIQGSSWAQFLDMRPLVTDSVPFGATDSVSTLFRRTPSGVITTCTVGDPYCYFYRSAPRASLTALMQDLDVTAWGVRPGLSVHAQLRGRTAQGDARELWPQANQTFDVLAAYVEYDRSPVLGRLGRQWVTSALGVFNFDGASVTVHPVPMLGLSAYGGGTLVQGLDRPLGAAALSPVEDIPPVDKSFLVGGTLQFRPSTERRRAGTVPTRGPERSRRSLLGAAGRNCRVPRAAGDASAGRPRAIWPRKPSTIWPPMSASIPGTASGPASNTGTTRRTSTSGPSGVPSLRWDTTRFTGTLNWAHPHRAHGVRAHRWIPQYADTYTGVASLPLRTSGWRVGANGLPPRHRPLVGPGQLRHGHQLRRVQHRRRRLHSLAAQ